MKVNFGVGVFLFLCFFGLVSCSNESESESEQSTISVVDQNSSTSEILEALSKELKVLKQNNQAQDKVIEELKGRFESSQEKCDEQFATLSKNFDDFKSEISEDSGVWLMKQPLRGPPGKQGEKGEKGENGQPGPKGDQGPIDPRSLTSCSVAMELLPSPRSKKQTIYPYGNTKKVEVLCDFENDGGGWTLIQKRARGPKQEFQKNWNEYEKGFGSLDGNFWLGLENIHALTKNGDQEFRIELEDFEGEKKWVKYSRFLISDASDFYRLTIGGFYESSTAGDSMANRSLGSVNNGMRFSTKDKGNDNRGGSCAGERGGGGWWFNGCGASGLNGLYLEKTETGSSYTGIGWYSWKRWTVSLAKSEMKIRTRKS